MTEMTEKEVEVFVNCLMSGLCAGMLFDVFRVIRKSFRKKRFLTDLCDGIFWSLYTVIFVWWIFKVNDGALRWFVFAGMSIGGAIYFSVLSNFFVPLGLFVSYLLQKFVKTAVLILLFPVKIFLKLSRKFFVCAIIPVRKINKKIAILGCFFKRKARIRKFCTKKL